MRRHPIVLAATALVALAIACGSGSGHGNPSATAISNLSQSEIDALHVLAGRLESEGKARPAIPLYLPITLERLPFEANGSSDGTTLVFSQGATPAPGHAVYLTSLDLAQGPGSVVLVSPLIDLDGIAANVQSVPSDTTHQVAGYVLTFNFGGHQVLVGANWITADGLVTDEIARETQLIAKSLIADMKNEGLAREP